MMRRRRPLPRHALPWIALACLASAPTLPGAAGGVNAQERPGRAAAAAEADVPEDLNPLLTPAPSEMRFVTRRYLLDRATLQDNFATGEQVRRFGRGFAGRAGEAAEEAERAEPVSLSTARIARLKRFQADWREALAGLDASGFSADGRTDLAALRDTLDAYDARLAGEEADLRRLTPLAPFGPALVDLVEARIRVEPVDSRAAAGILTEVTEQVAGMRSRLEAGLRARTEPSGAPRAPDDVDGALTLEPELARVAAATVEGLQRDLASWYEFWHGYHPLFTWWMEMPYARVDSALTGYAAFLRDEVAPAGLATSGLAVDAAPIAMAPPPPWDEVPDLAELTSLPHDEMTDVVARFRGVGSGGRGRRGDAPERDAAWYRDWLTALETLDFDGLSRNAQVDYLYIRRTAHLALEREGVELPANPPRKQDDSGIPGDARGREGLIRDLEDVFISYTPEELLALAEKEFAKADAEMVRASREMGFGDDWKAAMEKVKTMHPPPGGQPVVIMGMLHEAIDYLRDHDLLTIPEVGAESLHMNMMSPERQLVNPFFLGGARMMVSYPTNTMTYDARLQSMRGNNTPFSHATAFHEMIPGHNLVYLMNGRYAGYRAGLGDTPFYGEGWPLYWELTLYERGFQDTPEERIGALFWRMHRCARIIFSLKFHMGEWSPQEAVDFLVERVNFEPANARAEVLRSFEGGYAPLYQAAYLLGGLQLQGLHRELVESGKMTEKAFHDEVLRQGSMPIELLRLSMGDMPLSPDMSLDWKFYVDLE